MILYRTCYLTFAAAAVLLIFAFPAPVWGAEEASQAGAVAEETPAIAARIGADEVITEEEFDRTINAMMQHAQARNRGQGGPVSLSNEERLTILNNIADMKVLYLVAKDAGSSPTEDAIKARLDEIRGGLPPEVTLEEALEKTRSSLDELTENIRQQLTIGGYVEGQTKDLLATDEEVAKRYDDLKVTPRLNRPQETVDVAHILVKVPAGADEEAWTAAKTRIDAARERIVTGKEDFGAIAAEVSEDPGSKENGGLYREVARGRMVPEFDKASFETPVGEVTEPFRTQFGWHFLTVKAKHAAGVMTLEEATDLLKNMIEGEKRKEKLSAIIAEAKKEEKYKVEILLEPGPEPKAEEAAEDTDAVIIDEST